MESSNSLNLFARHPSGYTVQLTIRSENGADLIKRFDGLLEWLQKTGCSPADRPDVANGKAAAAPMPAAVAEPHADDPSWCTIHQVEMAKHTKDNQIWYSHKSPDGTWCRGKANGKSK